MLLGYSRGAFCAQMVNNDQQIWILKAPIHVLTLLQFAQLINQFPPAEVEGFPNEM
jgi:hypothetical protein